MTGDGAAAPGDGSTAEEADSLPFDIRVAHQARIYDYLLGGKDHFAADRAAAKEMLQIYPDTVRSARANRLFLGRAVRYLAETGVRQFLDIGTGIPTVGNTHEVAQSVAPESRVVYVDHDPIVLAHARALLISRAEGATDYVDADLRATTAIVSRAQQLLDFTRPVAVTLLAILHAVPDADDPYEIVATLMDAVPPGSYLAISHGASDLIDATALQGLYDSFKGNVRQQFQWRTRDQVARFFAGTDLVEPGLVGVDDWRSEPDPGAGDTSKSAMWAAVGRKS
jgi:trans-aconitate methyltransferase